jgi:hypothetical protein
MSFVRAVGRKILVENELIRNFLEAFGSGLPREIRVMKVACRSKTLRERAIRRIVAQKVPDPFPALSSHLVSGPPLEETVAELNEKGFAAGIAIPDSSLRGILDYCSGAKFKSGRDGREISIDLRREENPLSPTHHIYRLQEPQNHCEEINRIAHDPFMVEVARRYLKTEPVLVDARIWWSYPYVDSAGNPLRTPDFGFHYDIDDYKFLKVFFYLIDVDEERGPHVIVAGTHHGKDFYEKLHRRLTDEQAASRYGDRITVMTGRSGTGFFEDTFCYHKGANPKKRRLLMEFEYSLRRFS